MSGQLELALPSAAPGPSQWPVCGELTLVVDSVTYEEVPQYDACVDCGVAGYGPCYDIPSRGRSSVRTADGWWVTRSSCNCGRLRYVSLYNGAVVSAWRWRSGKYQP